jgi:hypothetical protein
LRPTGGIAEAGTGTGASAIVAWGAEVLAVFAMPVVSVLPAVVALVVVFAIREAAIPVDRAALPSEETRVFVVGGAGCDEEPFVDRAADVLAAAGEATTSTSSEATMSARRRICRG